MGHAEWARQRIVPDPISLLGWSLSPACRVTHVRLPLGEPRSERWSVPPLASRGSDVWPGILSPAIRSTISIIYLAPGSFDADLPPQIACHRTRVSPSASTRSSLALRLPRDGLFLFLAGRLPVHFSTVFPLERRDMVMGGAAERRLQASHRDRCTC